MQFEKTGQPITCLDDWHQFAGPKRHEHWAAGRSAYELARAWCTDGAPQMPQEMRDLLGYWEDTSEFEIEHGFPEHRIPFDDHLGEPRNADLAFVGSARGGRIAITVEAKADEPFGPTIGEALDAAFERALINPNSAGVRRIEDLVRALIPARKPMRPKITSLRYQLLTAAAGTLAFATDQRAMMGVLVIHEFKTDRTSLEKRSRNSEDVLAFINRLADGYEPTTTLGLHGPFFVVGNERMNPTIPLVIGKVRTDVRSLEHLRGPLLQGKTYDVIIRNVARMTRVGYSMKDAWELALKEAGVKTLPPKPKPSAPSPGSDA